MEFTKEDYLKVHRRDLNQLLDSEVPYADMFQQIYDQQKALDDMYMENLKYRPGATVPGPVDFARAIIHEATEIEDEHGWKWWKTNPPIDEARREAIIEEFIDVLHFDLHGLIRMGVSAEEIFARYMVKAAENIERQQTGKYALKHPCAGCEQYKPELTEQGKCPCDLALVPGDSCVGVMKQV